MTELLTRLKSRIALELEGVEPSAAGLRSTADGRYGEVVVEIAHDEEAESIRVSTAVPPPAGAGREFLVWCLSVNVQYWDVKVGIDDSGFVLVHSDLDAAPDAELDQLTEDIVERAETVVQLLDDDLVEWLLAHGFGTAGQRERWTSW